MSHAFDKFDFSYRVGGKRVDRFQVWQAACRAVLQEVEAVKCWDLDDQHVHKEAVVATIRSVGGLTDPDPEA